METLGKLFGSSARIKVMRLFMLNGRSGFENKDIIKRSKISPSSARKELSLLSGAGFIKKRNFTKEVETPTGHLKKKKTTGWFLNENYPYLASVQNLLVDSCSMNREDIMKRFKKAGRIKLFIVAGIFTKDEESRLDLMIVGDNLKRNIIEASVRNLEAELGRELSYAVFETIEFTYRLDMYDKLVCDVLDYPHETLVSIPALSTKVSV